MSGTIDSFDLQKAREMCERATPGPWVDRLGNITCPEMKIYNCKSGDLVFILAARSLLPAAIKRIEELDARLSESSTYTALERLGDYLEETKNFDEYPMVVQSAISALRRHTKLIRDLEEHEQQTHEILGNILGRDDTLEENAIKDIKRIRVLEKALIEERSNVIQEGSYYIVWRYQNGIDKLSIDDQWKAFEAKAKEELHTEGLL